MCTRCTFLGGVASLVAAPAVASARTGDPTELELAIPGMRRIGDSVWLGRLSRNVWLHTSTHDLGGGDYYPANGGIVVDGDRALMIDTSWTNEQTETIAAEWERRRMPSIAKALVTHWHGDRLGGIGALSKRGIPAYGNPLTIGLAIDKGHVPPRPLHDVEKAPQRIFGVEAFYPGAGHTIDNLVAWVPSDRVLFGGCLVKATTAHDLGYLGDADLAAWPATIRRVAGRYSPLYRIPGHGTIAGDSVAHTIALAEEKDRVRPA